MRRIVVATVAVLLAAAPVERTLQWSGAVASADLRVAVRPAGQREELAVEVRPRPGMAVRPPVVRVDGSSLVRTAVAARLPTSIRGPASGPIRGALPLAQAGTLGIASPDSYDGTVRLEYRYCAEGAATCSVERVDIAIDLLR